MSQEPRRGLAAVMFADMVGFTALMGEDEAAARGARDHQRDVVGRLVGRFGGEVRQYYGDGTLATFASAVEAARCAIAIQRALALPPAVPLRIGLHVGDIAEDGGGVYGDGVNVAARVEGLAEAGAVVVSDRVFEEIRNQRELSAKSLGRVRLENVRREVGVFALTNEGLVVPDAPAGTRHAHAGHPTLRRALGWVGAAALLGLGWALTRTPAEEGGSRAAAARAHPSIAGIPFRNLAAERENPAFFADEAEALRVAASLDGPIGQQIAIHTASLMNALVHWSRGRPGQARAAADSAVAELSGPGFAGDDPRVQAARGTALAVLGRRDEALAAGRAAVRLLPISADGLDGPEYLLHLARIHAILGEDDEAVEVIRELLSVHSAHSLTSILLHPVFAPLRDHPGFGPLRGRAARR